MRAAIVLAATACLGGAAPALAADGYTLNITPPPSALTVGATGIFQATGSNPPDDFFASWLDVAAIPASVLASCPADYLNANQIARSTSADGGEVVVTAQRENVDDAGRFSMPFAYTPTHSGRFLICGYTNDGATGTLATSFLTVDVAAPPPVVVAPVNVKKPRVARSGRKLVCRKGSWSNAPTRYSYGWLVDGRRKRGATGRRLAITRKLRDRKVQCRVRASNAAGAVAATSRARRL